MKKILLVLIGIVSFSQFSEAAFSAKFKSFQVLVVNTDGQPMANMRVRYQKMATKSSTCGGHRGSPFDWGKPCWVRYDVDGQGSMNYVVTDSNGRATIPALSYSDISLTAGKAELEIGPWGVDVPLQTNQGTYRCMPQGEYIDAYDVSDKRGITADVSEELSRTVLKFTYKEWSRYWEFSYQEYLKRVEEIAAKQYNEIGDQYMTRVGFCFK